MSISNRSDQRLWALESIRGIAAFYVFLHHFAHFALEESYPRFARLFVLGQPAVMIFFIMSGFVIYHSTDVSVGFRDYFVRRFRRIYPLFVISLALAYLGQCAMQHTLLMPSPRDLLVNLLMLQDGGSKPGILAGPFMGNSPLWSLSYEWFFYMAFFPVVTLIQARPDLQKYAVAALSLLGFVSYFAFPNPISLYLMYFVLWWSGVELAREYDATGKVTWRGQGFSLASITVLSLLWFAKVQAARSLGNTSPWDHPALEFRHFVTTGVILGCGLIWYHLGGKGFRTLLGWGRFLAPISYAIYICHVPIIDLSKGLKLTGSPWIDFFWVLPVTFAIAYLLERKLQPWINRKSRRWLTVQGARSMAARPPGLGQTAQSLGTK